MKVYVAHSTSFNFIEDLYIPLKESALWQQHQFILPHEKSLVVNSSRQLIKTVDLYPSHLKLRS